MANIYKTDKNRVIEFAGRLTKGIQQTENIVENTDEIEFKWKDLDNMVSPWSEKFDNTEGGTNGAPKFPMPNAYNFLLKYGHLSNNPEVSEHVELTLDKMAFGGIYDQIGGGFARYSVDKYWKAPHFEKMLYDNGQLVSLYSEAYLKHQKPLYKEVVFENTDLKEITFQGALDPHTPVGQGWLRASHRKVDSEKSEEWRPYHTHDEKQLLIPDQIYPLDIEIWPSCIVVPKGYRVALSVRGKDYVYPGPVDSGLSNLKNAFTGVGPFLHDDPNDRPVEIFDNEVTLHFSEDKQPFILLPVIPKA